jgi:hypothetical protein
MGQVSRGVSFRRDLARTRRQLDGVGDRIGSPKAWRYGGWMEFENEGDGGVDDTELG